MLGDSLANTSNTDITGAGNVVQLRTSFLFKVNVFNGCGGENEKGDAKVLALC